MATWKNVERQIAKRLGGERVPVTGRQRGSAPDIEHDWLSHRKTLPAWLADAMSQAVASQRGEQLPMVVLHEKQMNYDDSYCVIRLRDFIEWFGGESPDKQITESSG